MHIDWSSTGDVSTTDIKTRHVSNRNDSSLGSTSAEFYRCASRFLQATTGNESWTWKKDNDKSIK